MPETAQLTRFLRNLRAVREYTPEGIDEDVLRNIVEIGRWSGSASNKQPTEIVVVREPEKLKLIGDSGVRPAGGAARPSTGRPSLPRRPAAGTPAARWGSGATPGSAG